MTSEASVTVVFLSGCVLHIVLGCKPGCKTKSTLKCTYSAYIVRRCYVSAVKPNRTHYGGGEAISPAFAPKCMVRLNLNTISTLTSVRSRSGLLIKADQTQESTDS